MKEKRLPANKTRDLLNSICAVNAANCHRIDTCTNVDRDGNKYK